MAEPATLCERLEAIQEALRQGRDRLFQLNSVAAEREAEALTARLVQELAGAAADLTYQVQMLYAVLQETFCRG